MLKWLQRSYIVVGPNAPRHVRRRVNELNRRGGVNRVTRIGWLNLIGWQLAAMVIGTLVPPLYYVVSLGSMIYVWPVYFGVGRLVTGYKYARDTVTDQTLITLDRDWLRVIDAESGSVGPTLDAQRYAYLGAKGLIRNADDASRAKLIEDARDLVARLEDETRVPR